MIISLESRRKVCDQITGKKEESMYNHITGKKEACIIRSYDDIPEQAQFLFVPLDHVDAVPLHVGTGVLPSVHPSTQTLPLVNKDEDEGRG